MYKQYKHVYKNEDIAKRDCRPQMRLGATTTTESTVAVRVINETKSGNARQGESARREMSRRRRASGDFVAASSSTPPVSEAEAAHECVGFFSPLAETTHSHCVQATTDVNHLVIGVDRGRDGTAVASRATLFTDDDEVQRFLDAEWQHSEDKGEERDQQTLIELYRDLLEASTSRRRRPHSAGVFDASGLPDDEGRLSASVAAAVQPHGEDDDDDDVDPTRRRVLMRNCSSCKHDLPAATHFYSDRKTCRACLRYHLRYARRKRKREKMEQQTAS